MSPDELAILQMSFSRRHDLRLGTAGIGDERAWLRLQPPQHFDDLEDRLGEINQVRFRFDTFESRAFIDHAEAHGLGNRACGTDSEYAARKARLAKRKREGASDQADAGNSDNPHLHRPADGGGDQLALSHHFLKLLRL